MLDSEKHITECAGKQLFPLAVSGTFRRILQPVRPVPEQASCKVRTMWHRSLSEQDAHPGTSIR